MDEQFIKRLHTLNRRDELKSRLQVEGVKPTLKRKQVKDNRAFAIKRHSPTKTVSAL